MVDKPNPIRLLLVVLLIHLLTPRVGIAQINSYPIASGVVPHHMVAQPIIEEFYQQLSAKGDPHSIIILSPDHFKSSTLLEKPFVSSGSEQSKFLGVTVNVELLHKLNISSLDFLHSCG